MSTRIARRFRVTGKVQGVWFRESTRREADRLGVEGHAINRPDGSVEVVAAGEAGAVDRLAEWLKTGPPMARVDEVVGEDVEDSGISGFRTG